MTRIGARKFLFKSELFLFYTQLLGLDAGYSRNQIEKLIDFNDNINELKFISAKLAELAINLRLSFYFDGKIVRIKHFAK